MVVKKPLIGLDFFFFWGGYWGVYPVISHDFMKGVMVWKQVTPFQI